MNLDWCFVVVWPQRQTFVRILLQQPESESARADVRRFFRGLHAPQRHHRLRNGRLTRSCRRALRIESRDRLPAEYPAHCKTPSRSPRRRLRPWIRRRRHRARRRRVQHRAHTRRRIVPVNGVHGPQPFLVADWPLHLPHVPRQLHAARFPTRRRLRPRNGRLARPCRGALLRRSASSK